MLAETKLQADVSYVSAFNLKNSNVWPPNALNYLSQLDLSTIHEELQEELCKDA